MALFLKISIAPFLLNIRASASRQFPPSTGKMWRSGEGRSGSSPNSDSSPAFVPVGNVKPKKLSSSQTYSSNKDEQCTPNYMKRRVAVLEQSQSMFMDDRYYDEQFPPLGAASSSGSKNSNSKKREPRIDLQSKEIEEKTPNVSSSQFKNSSVEGSTSQLDGSSLPSQFGKKRVPIYVLSHVTSSSKNKPFSKRRTRVDLELEKPDGVSSSIYDNGDVPIIRPFDICLPSRKRSSVSKHCVQFEDDGGTLNETDSSMEEGTNRILRPGMVLLKHYLTISEQVEIVKNCQELGRGPGGFYQPGYKDGAKLRLQMMCLGSDWDPQTRKYQKQRSVDGCEPPKIPLKFTRLVKRAIQDAHALIIEDSGVKNVEGILPAMSPDLCIVNFYSTTGKLGLHQDRDESKESIWRGLPVVSFSIGDSAEFLYSDNRDVHKAEEVILDSGDLVIFGGESRLVFHGVPCIIPNSAPEVLLRDARLRPGRLNLTFRKL